MKRVIKNIPAFLFLYLGLLGLLFFGIYILNQWVEESFMIAMMLGFYGGLCVFDSCMAFLNIPFIPILAIVIILIIFSLFFTKTEEAIVRFRKIAFKFLITVIAVDVSILLILPFFNKMQMLQVSDSFSDKHLFNVEVPTNLESVTNDLNAKNYIVNDLESDGIYVEDRTGKIVHKAISECIVVSRVESYCVEENLSVNSENRYFYGDSRMRLVSPNNPNFNMEPFDNNIEIVAVFDNFIYVQSSTVTELIDKKTGKMYYDDWILDNQKRWYEEFDLDFAIVEKNKAIAKKIKNHFKIIKEEIRNKKNDNLQESDLERSDDIVISEWREYINEKDGYKISFPAEFFVDGDHNIMNYDIHDPKYNMGNSNGIKIQIQKHVLGNGFESISDYRSYLINLNNNFEKPAEICNLGNAIELCQYTENGPGGAFMAYKVFDENSNIYYTILVFEPTYSSNKDLVESIVKTFTLL